MLTAYVNITLMSVEISFCAQTQIASGCLGSRNFIWTQEKSNGGNLAAPFPGCLVNFRYWIHYILSRLNSRDKSRQNIFCPVFS
jgi:hypothetical protein